MKPTIIPAAEIRDVAVYSNTRHRMARAALLAALARLEHGELRLLDEASEQRFGHKSARCPLTATLRVRDPRFYPAAAIRSPASSCCAREMVVVVTRQP